MEECRIRIDDKNADTCDELVLNSINTMMNLRNDFIAIMSVIFKYGYCIDLEVIKKFLENLIRFQFPLEGQGVHYEVEYDNYKFLMYELVLYLIAVMLKYEKYNEASFIINSSYFYRESNRSPLEYKNISVFNCPIVSLDRIRKNRLQLNRTCITADIIKVRSIYPGVGFEDIVDVDCILSITTAMEDKDGYMMDIWYPKCNIYTSYRRNELFKKMISKRHFEKVKVLLKVNTADEFKDIIKQVIEKSYKVGYSAIYNVNSLINLEKICTIE